MERLRQHNRNQAVAKLVMNLQGLEDVRLSGKRLVQLAAPICQTPSSPWGQAHFMAAHKWLGPWLISTPVLNVMVLWVMTAALYLALDLSILPRVIAAADSLRQRLRRGAQG